jgi:hypothetical protein
MHMHTDRPATQSDSEQCRSTPPARWQTVALPIATQPFPNHQCSKHTNTNKYLAKVKVTRGFLTEHRRPDESILLRPGRSLLLVRQR